MKFLILIQSIMFSVIAFGEEDFEKCWIDAKQQTNVNISSLMDSFTGRFSKQGKTGHLKCTYYGLPRVDMKYVNGKGTGKEWQYRLDGMYSKVKDKNKGWWAVRDYKNGLQHGPYKMYQDGLVSEEGIYVNDKSSWSKKYKDGKLNEARAEDPTNNRGYYARFNPNGQLMTLDCTKYWQPIAPLYKACGFGGKIATKLYGYDGKEKETRVYQNGEMLSADEDSGSSSWTAGSKKTYKNGKLHGMITLTNAKEKTKTTGKYVNGNQEGTHKTYNEDKKLIEKKVFKNGEQKVWVQYFLNGKPKRIEKMKSDKEKYVKAYHDNGRVEEEGTWIKCEKRYYYGWKWRGWCPDGKHKSYWEDGRKSRVLNFDGDKLSGTQKDYDSNGKLVYKEEYKEGSLHSRKSYKNGKLTRHEVFEKDGSRTKNETYTH